jgi:hypothetical protein
MIAKRRSRQFLLVLEKKINETSRDLKRTERKLEKLYLKKGLFNYHVVRVCHEFAKLVLRGGSEKERQRLTRLFASLEDVWKRDRSRLANEIKQAKEKRSALQVRLARLEKKF